MRAKAKPLQREAASLADPADDAAATRSGCFAQDRAPPAKRRRRQVAARAYQPPEVTPICTCSNRRDTIICMIKWRCAGDAVVCDGSPLEVQYVQPGGGGSAVPGEVRGGAFALEASSSRGPPQQLCSAPNGPAFLAAFSENPRTCDEDGEVRMRRNGYIALQRQNIEDLFVLCSAGVLKLRSASSHGQWVVAVVRFVTPVLTDSESDDDANHLNERGPCSRCNAFRVCNLPARERERLAEAQRRILLLCCRAASRQRRAEKIEWSLLYRAIAPGDRFCDARLSVDELQTDLLPFQRRAVAWMVAREEGRCGECGRASHMHASASQSSGCGCACAPADPSWIPVPCDQGSFYVHIESGRVASSPPLWAGLAGLRGGLLADEMGLGKTVDVLALVLARRRIHTDVDQDAHRIQCIVEDTGYTKGASLEAECAELSRKEQTAAYTDTPSWEQRDLLCSTPDGGTLLVCPDAIAPQWCSEIHRHVKAHTLRVCLYQGASHSRVMRSSLSFPGTVEVLAGNQRALDVAEFDLVITTYETLRAEVYHCAPARRSSRLREDNRGAAKSAQSPLPAIRWMRVVCDEAQRVAGGASAAARMAAMLNCRHRWSVTGTPLSRGWEDIAGLCTFLHADPLDRPRVWEEAFGDPLSVGDVNAAERLGRTVRALAWRLGAREAAAAIPAQRTRILGVSLTPVEAHWYTREREAACMAQTAVGRAAALVRLRQACCWDACRQSARGSRRRANLAQRRSRAGVLQARCNMCGRDRVEMSIAVETGRGDVLGSLDGPLGCPSCREALLREQQAPPASTGGGSLETLVATLSTRARIEAEEALRVYVLAENGAAGAALLAGDPRDAAGRYRRVLTAAAEDQSVRLDDFQRLHALTGLADALDLLRAPESDTALPVPGYDVDPHIGSDYEQSDPGNSSGGGQGVSGGERGRSAGTESECAEDATAASYRNEAAALTAQLESRARESAAAARAALRKRTRAAFRALRNSSPEGILCAWVVGSRTPIVDDGMRGEARNCRVAGENTADFHLADSHHENEATERMLSRMPWSAGERVATAARLGALRDAATVADAAQGALRASRSVLERSQWSDTDVAAAIVCARCRGDGPGRSAQHCLLCGADQRLTALDHALRVAGSRLESGAARVLAELGGAAGAAAAAFVRSTGWCALEEQDCGDNDAGGTTADETATLDRAAEGEVYRSDTSAPVVGMRSGEDRADSIPATADGAATRDSSDCAAFDRAVAAVQASRVINLLRDIVMYGRRAFVAQHADVGVRDEVRMSVQRVALLREGEVPLPGTEHAFIHASEVWQHRIRLQREAQDARRRCVAARGQLAYIQSLGGRLHASGASACLGECPVCTEELSAARAVFPCGHMLCAECAAALASAAGSRKRFLRCPTCRRVSDRREVALVGISGESVVERAALLCDGDGSNGIRSNRHRPSDAHAGRGAAALAAAGHEQPAGEHVESQGPAPALPKHPSFDAFSSSEGEVLHLPGDTARQSSKLASLAALVLRIASGSFEPELGRGAAARRAVILSQWAGLLTAAARALDDVGVSYILADGAGRRFAERVTAFRRAESCTALLMPLQRGGNGLNLTEAATVILLEPSLDPGVEEQAGGRVRRLGQVCRTQLIRAIVEDTVEERILISNRARLARVGSVAAAVGARSAAHAVSDEPSEDEMKFLLGD